MLLPYEPALHIECHDLAGSEPGINPAPIRDGAGRSEIVLLVNGGQFPFGLHGVFPNPPSTGSIKCADKKRYSGVRGQSSARERALRGCGVSALPEPRTRAGYTIAKLRRDKDPIAPDYRSRNAKTADRCFPRNVFGIT